MIHCNKPLSRFLLLTAFLLSALLAFTRVAQTQNNEFQAAPLAPGSRYQIEKVDLDQPQESGTTAVPPQTESVNRDESGESDDAADRHQSPDENIMPGGGWGGAAASVRLTIACSPTQATVGQTVACTISMQNKTGSPLPVELRNFVPPHLNITPGSVSGADLINNRFVTFFGTLAAGTPAEFVIADGPSPAGYVSLAGLGIPPLADVGDDALFNFATDPFLYLGQSYTVLGATSNGYVVPGGGSEADLGQPPQLFPDPTPPNNVIAPFWTDLDPSAGGNMYAANVIGGDRSWVVIEWENVPAFGGEDAYTFQVWLASNTTEEDVSLVYQRVDGSGAASGLSVGAENATGSDGANFDGVPTPEDQLKALITPASLGEAHIISYQTTARNPGHWKNCARLNIPDLRQREVACVIGRNFR